MQLPDTVYRAFPFYWLVVGILFIAAGLYLGADYPGVHAYYLFGGACTLWSLWVLAMRTLKASGRDTTARPSDE